MIQRESFIQKLLSEMKIIYSYNKSYCYVGIVENAVITEPAQEIEIFKGEHLNGKTDFDVSTLYFVNSPNLLYFPRDLNKHFLKLQHLYFKNCGIKEISKRNLKGYQNLSTLHLIKCQLTSLPDDLFTKMPNLTSVSFDNNQIESASSKFLEPFVGKSRIKIDLCFNKNIDADYDSINIKGSTHESLEDLMKEIDEKCHKTIVTPAAEDFNHLIKNLWTSRDYSDLKIISGNKEFNVHRIILAARSPVMAEIIEGNKEATEIKINDFSPLAVESLLHFVYTNETIHDNNYTENFVIAHQFKILKMEFIYEGIISNNLQSSNADKAFPIADKNATNDLKKKAFKIIADKFHLPETLMDNPIKLKKAIDIHHELEKLRE